MGLVDYSESEGSDDEAQPQPTLRDAKSTNAKQSFQKVVDRSNPSKIKVSLPTPATTGLDLKPEESERPAKKQKTSGGGLFSGLNSFLPAPKRSAGADAVAPTGEGKKLGLGRGLGSGVSLRTGATPAFSRAAPTPSGEQSSGSGSNDHAPGSGSHAYDETPSIASALPEPEVKLIGKSTIFRPLSVARKNQKKKKPVFTSTGFASKATARGSNISGAAPQQVEHIVPPKAKVSLFSMAQNEDVPLGPAREASIAPQIENDDYAEEEDEEVEQYIQAAQAYHDPQTLGSIASELNLDEAAKRQLFGRRGRGNEVPTNLVNFDTDKEYNANEELRAAGETVQHKALRSIQPGKHSLRQLVTAASTQKEALEESWAAGRRNKKEAGNKYGW
jgi:hypothetical protein